MKLKGKRFETILKAAATLAVAAAWISVPLLSDPVAAGGVPILIRTANLVSPSGSINPHGFAEYELYANGHRELEIEVEDVNLPAGTVMNAVVDGNSVGSLILQSDRRGELKLRTEDGQNVPVTNDGSTVQVIANNNVLVAGIYGGGGPNPGPTASPSPTSSPTGSPNPGPTASPTGSPNPSPSPSPTSSPNSGNLFAGLTGPTLNGVLPSGYAEFEIHSSRLELEIRLRQINLQSGSSLPVRVDNVAVGNVIVESDGEGRLRLRTDNGQTVPPVVVGSTITISYGGNVILNGTFAGFSGPSPSPSPSPGSTPGPTPSPGPSLGRSFEAHLTGNGMQPPVQTNATGEFKVTLNAAETQATIFGEFHNLGSSQTGARIETTTSASVTVHDFGAVGGTNGNFASVTVDVSAALVQQLRTGLWSAVITSSGNPGGEIVGRLTPRSNESDFDGNGSHDFAVFRPSTNVWYSQNESGFSATIFGSGDARIVSGDYDGDGKTDTAVFRNVNGNGIWEIRRSSDGGITAAQFGFATDTPARGDFDGDGRADIAVYRPSTGFWYVQRSSDRGYSIVHFGLPEDKPMPADMDGDGKDDIAVFRPSTGVWYWLRSSNGAFGGVHFGMNGDVPVRGDFDGDGKNDLTVYRPSTGVWYTLKSTGGYQILQFGLNGDIPVAGNYDGDGKTDVAVFRPSDGYWYILRTTDGTFQTFPFGLNGDIPLVAR
jgi:hypothetical protein